MDVNNKDEFEMDKRDDSPMDYSSSALMSLDFQFTSANVVNSSLGQVPACRGSVSSGLSASIARTSIPGQWDTIVSPQTVGFCDINAPHIAGVSSAMGMRKISPPSGSGCDGTMEWHPSNSMLEGGIFLPNAPGRIPQGLSHIPANSAFVEHAPRFSCFNGGNFADIIIQIPESLGPCSQGGSMMQGQFELIAGSGQAQESGMNMADASMDAPLPTNSVATSESPLKNNRRSEGRETSMDEAKRCASGSGNESHEAEFSRGQDEPSMFNGGESSVKSLGLKRCRSMQDYNQGKVNQHSGEAYKDSPDIQQKTDQNPTPTTTKTMGKQGKQVLQTPDPPKEEYIHVRVHGRQATNSHSLSERVRREKISERMKLLQDLVPGCNKVTRKAMMLDEIINYVQSLQRQVEFLSMKLTTVNSRLDFNLEELLAKDIIQPWAASSSSLAFSPDVSIVYPPLHPSQPGDITAGLAGMESRAHVLRRSTFPQLTPMAGVLKDNPQTTGHYSYSMRYDDPVPGYQQAMINGLLKRKNELKQQLLSEKPSGKKNLFILVVLISVIVVMGWKLYNNKSCCNSCV